jgi:hypothetical protein
MFALVVCLVAASAGGLFALLQGRSSAAGPWVPPISAINRGILDPALALEGLAGIDPASTIDRALANNHLDDAFAIALLDVTLSDQARAGTLLILGQRFLERHQTALGLLSLRTAATIAILSPDLTDGARASLLLRIAQELTALDDRPTALQVLDRANELVRFSTSLSPAYAEVLRQGLDQEYRRLGRPDATAERRGQPNDLVDQAVPPPPLSTLLAPEDALVESLGPRGQELRRVRAQRLEVAQKLASALGAAGRQPNEVLRQALESLLLTEDTLVGQVYNDGLDRLVDPGARATLARLRVQWLLVKWRIARQTFGVSLVPAWEANADALEHDLRGAYESYFLLLRDAAISLPDPVEAAEAQVAVLRAQLTVGRLGLYPQAPEGEILQALDSATRHCLTLQRSPGFYLAVRYERGIRTFVYLPADAYIR